MCRLGQTLFQQADIVVSCTGLLKPAEVKLRKTCRYFLYLYFLSRTYLSLSLFLSGHAEQKLKTLTQKVADSIIALISSNQHKS